MFEIHAFFERVRACSLINSVRAELQRTFDAITNRLSQPR
jgi:hypothetical protein